MGNFRRCPLDTRKVVSFRSHPLLLQTGNIVSQIDTNAGPRSRQNKLAGIYTVEWSSGNYLLSGGYSQP